MSKQDADSFAALSYLPIVEQPVMDLLEIQRKSIQSLQERGAPTTQIQQAVERRAVVEELMLYYRDLIKQLQSEKSAEYKRGFSAGMEKARKQGQQLDKEDIRQQSIDRARATWPELY